MGRFMALKRVLTGAVAAVTMLAMAPEAASFAFVDGAGNTLEWKTESGKQYWYENGVKQGVYGSKGNVWYWDGAAGKETERGREIYDPESDGWYWLDAIYDGAKAANKEVFMPYIYSDEEGKGADWISEVAALSNKTSETVKKDGGEVVDLSAQIAGAIKAHGGDGAGKWVRYDAEGKMVKGWYKVQGSDETLYPDQKGNVYYYDRQTGLMAKGDVTIDGVKYTFDTVSGKLTSGNAPYIADRNAGTDTNKEDNKTEDNKTEDNKTEDTKTEDTKTDNNADTGSDTKKNENTDNTVDLSNRPNANKKTGIAKELGVGDIAPDFTAELANGETFTLSDYDDKTVLINIWATWCGPCKSEMPAIQKLYEENDEDLVIVCVNCGETKAVVDEFVNTTGYTFNVAYDTDYTINTYYPTMYVPYTVIVRNGIVKKKFVGTQSYDSFKAAIEKAKTSSNNPLDDRANATLGIGDPVVLDVGDAAPDFTAELANGETFTLSDYDDKTVLINIWATWCGPCRSEMPDIQKLYEDNRDDLEIVCVNYEQSKTTVDNFLSQEGYTFNVAYDPDGTIVAYYPSSGIPYTVIVRGGIIKSIFVGTRDYDTFKKAVDKAAE